jgi:transposase-like protein
MSLLAFLKRFPDDDACWAHLEVVRWPAGPACPKCGTVGNAQPQKSRPHYWQCRGCRAVFTAAMGTPLEGTHLPMRSWFTALHLLAVSSKGISSVKLGEHLGIGQKTAWFLGQRIRRMMEDKDGLLKGIVEVDATHLGRKRRKKQASRRDPDDDQPTGRSGTRKSMVTVATQRDGRARAGKGRAHSERAIAAFVLRNLEIGNTALDRAIIGVWHWFSSKHTDRYLHEVSFRWNRRKLDADAWLAALFTATLRRLRWKELAA